MSGATNMARMQQSATVDGRRQTYQKLTTNTHAASRANSGP